MKRTVLVLAILLAVAACGDDDAINFATTTSVAVPIPSFTTSTAAATTTVAPVTTAAPTTTAAPATTAAPGTTAPGADLPDLPPGTPYSAFELYSIGSVEVSVPVEWFDRVEGSFIVNNLDVGPLMAASPDYDGLINGFTTPGVFIGATSDPTVTSDDIFAMKDFNGTCTYLGRDVYDDGEYRGHFDSWADCAGTLSDFVVIVAEPYAGGAIALVEITLVTDADLEALDSVLASWRLTGDLS